MNFRYGDLHSVLTHCPQVIVEIGFEHVYPSGNSVQSSFQKFQLMLNDGLNFYHITTGEQDTRIILNTLLPHSIEAPTKLDGITITKDEMPI
jgi:hypothetical protein